MAEDELIYYADATTYVTEPTMELRWNDGVLEQSFVIRSYENGKPKTIRNEWQPVPEAE